MASRDSKISQGEKKSKISTLCSSAWTDMLLFLAKAWGGFGIRTEGHVALLLKKEP